MSENLEATARALFKSWFVDFDAVRAKAEGRDPCLPRAVAKLFPDLLEELEVGDVPCGWRLGTLGDIADNPRRSLGRDEIDPATPYIALEHMPRRRIALTEWGTADGVESNKFLFEKGQILFGKLRPYFHKVGVAPVDGVCSTDILVVDAKKPWFSFVLCHVSSVAFVDFTSSGATGTKMPRTNWAEMARYPLSIPPVSLAAAFNEIVWPLVEKIAIGIHEARTLANIRDTLAPRLISGELPVQEAGNLDSRVPWP